MKCSIENPFIITIFDCSDDNISDNRRINRFYSDIFPNSLCRKGWPLLLTEISFMSTIKYRNNSNPIPTEG